MIATVVPQRGLADAAGFTLPTLAVPLSVVVGVAVTAVAGRLLVAAVTWPVVEIPTNTITAARTDVIRPLEFGGIGIRIRPVTAMLLTIDQSDDRPLYRQLAD